MQENDNNLSDCITENDPTLFTIRNIEILVNHVNPTERLLATPIWFIRGARAQSSVGDRPMLNVSLVQ